MPWHQEAMKEVEGCHKLRGAVNQAVIRRCPNGGTHLGKTKISCAEYIGVRSERRELKHLSSARKRKRSDSLNSGERNGKSLNLSHVITCLCCVKGVVGVVGPGKTVPGINLVCLVEVSWKGLPKRVTAS
jgi:hypothetical protein